MQESKICPQIFAALSATLILIEIGFHIGWASPSLAKLLSKDSDILITPSQGSWIVSFLLIGTIFGSIVSFHLVDRWGRKTLLLISSVPFSISCLLLSMAKNYWWFYLARLIAGFGGGGVMTAIPMYTSEIAEDRIRGGFGILITVMVNVGVLISFSVGPWVNRHTLISVGAIIQFISVVTFIWVPESPYYYAMKKAPHKIEKSLIWLRGTPNVHEEVKKIQNAVDFKRKHTGNMMKLFTVKGNRKALVITFGLLTCQQFSGTIPILAYSTIIFNEGKTGLSSSACVIVIGIVKLVFGTVIIFLADKAGRRVLLLASMSLCTVFLFGEGLYFHLKTNGINVTTISWLPLVAMIGYFISYVMGIGSVPLLMASEIFSCDVKALGMVFGTLYLGLTGIFVTKFYQIVADAYGIHVAFHIFTICSAVSVAFIYFIIPETKNLSLSEIQNKLHGVTKPML